MRLSIIIVLLIIATVVSADTIKRWDGTQYVTISTGGGTSTAPSESQSTILDKLATPTNGATLVLQQGSTEPATAPKLIVKDSVGATRMTIFADGSIGIE